MTTKSLIVTTCVALMALTFGEREARAQGRDAVLNGAIIGGAVGAGLGVAFTHAVRDSELGFTQYAQGALIFGAIGAAVGIGVDALFNRAALTPAGTQRRILIAPTIWRNVAGVRVRWRW